MTIDYGLTTNDERLRRATTGQRLVTRGPAVITHHQARHVHRLEVRQGETRNARKIVIVPASIRRADQPPAVSIVGQDDSIVSERRNDNGCLWTRRGASRSRNRSLQPIDLASGSRHGAACRRSRLRNFRFHRYRTPSRSRATAHAGGFRSRPHPVVQHMVECESYGMLNRTARCAGCVRADYLVGISEQRRYRKSCGIGSPRALRCQSIRSHVGPKRVGGIRPRATFIDSLPHFV